MHYNSLKNQPRSVYLVSVSRYQRPLTDRPWKKVIPTTFFELYFHFLIQIITPHLNVYRQIISLGIYLQNETLSKKCKHLYPVKSKTVRLLTIFEFQLMIAFTVFTIYRNPNEIHVHNLKNQSKEEEEKLAPINIVF